MIFVSSAIAGTMASSDWGYSIYGTYNTLNTPYTAVGLAEWISTSNVTGNANPNPPGNIGTILMNAMASSTVVSMVYTAA